MNPLSSASSSTSGEFDVLIDSCKVATDLLINESISVVLNMAKNSLSCVSIDKEEMLEKMLTDVYRSPKAIRLARKIILASNGPKETLRLKHCEFDAYIHPLVLSVIHKFTEEYLLKKTQDHGIKFLNEMGIDSPPQRALLWENIGQNIDTHLDIFASGNRLQTRKMNQRHAEKVKEARKAFEEMIELRSTLEQIASLYKCSFDELLSKIAEHRHCAIEKVEKYSFLDYKKLLADLNFEQLCGAGSTSKSGFSKHAKSSKGPKRREKGSAKTIPVKAAAPASTPSRAASSSRSSAASSSTGCRPISAADKRELLCGELIRTPSKFCLLPRIVRWNTSDSALIRQFRDYSRDGSPIYRYGEISDEDITIQRSRHHLPGLEIVLSNEVFRAIYSQPSAQGYTFLSELNYGTDSEFGLVKLGIEGNKIYHCYFETVDHKKSIFQLMNPTFAPFQEGYENDGGEFISTLPYSFMLDDQGILTLKLEHESHFLRIFPLQKELLDKALESIRVIPV